MTKSELDVSMSRLTTAQKLYNNAMNTRSVYDSFKGVVRDSIREAERLEIKPVNCFSVEIPLTDDVERVLDIIEGVLRKKAEEASEAFEEFKV